MIQGLRGDWTFEEGRKYEILLSGSVGSAKSLLMAHIGITHCLNNPGSRFLWGRKSMPDLKATIIQKCREHLALDLVEGEDYTFNKTSSEFTFANGSQMIARSWHDKQFTRLRSLELSAAGIEELTENGDEYKHAYDELYARIGRLPHVKESFLISATNPDGPAHWAYKRFFLSPHPDRKIFLSRTEENPFLSKGYIQGLKENMDPKLARRLLYGEWVEIKSDSVYHAYDRDKNFRDEDYKPDLRFPIHVCWDFNIGLGKPLSACFFQYIGGTFHVFAEVVIDGARTRDSLDEMFFRGLLNHNTPYCIHGDASGRAKSTKAVESDWDIIIKYFQNLVIMDQGRARPMRMVFEVPVDNPAIRKRHNTVNAHCLNELKQVRLYVYKGAPTVDEALRLTALKKGAGYVEDDSKSFQHVGTALGYGMVWCVDHKSPMKAQSQTR